MTQTVSLTETTAGLHLDPVFRSSPFVLSASAVTGVSVYRGQLWRRPQDAREADATPLATSYASESSETVHIAFSGIQMDMALQAGAGSYDDLWITLALVQGDGQSVVCRADWLRVIESGCDPLAFVVEGVDVTVDEETSTAFFTIGGVTYEMPLVPETTITPGDSGWVTSIVNGTVIFTKDGVSYSAQVVPA